MRQHRINTVEPVLITATRGMIGSGVGLLIASRLPGNRRRIVGSTVD